VTYTLAIIPCTGVKDPYMEEGPAQEIWVGAHFQYTLAYVEEFFDEVLVMSYKYGLIKPSDTIQSYDIDMRVAKPREHIRWWYKLKTQIDDLADNNPPELVALFTGSFDRDRVIREFVKHGVDSIVIPWEGKGIGLRQQAVFDAEDPYDRAKLKEGGYKIDLTEGGVPRSKYLPPETKLTDDIIWE
jgi:hypothetical protein